MKVKISQIQVGKRKRPVKDIEPLKRSIRELGLLNPITITPDFNLVAGLHRLTACKELGFDEIDAEVRELDGLRAELAEIDENIVRNQLTALEESLQLARRKEIYEALHPETKNGKTPGNQYTGQKRENDTVSFSQDSAQKTGRSKRTIERKSTIGESLHEIKDDIFGTGIEDNQKALEQLSRVAKKQGADVAKEVLGIALDQASTNGSAGGKKIVGKGLSIKNALRHYTRSKEAEVAKTLVLGHSDVDFRHGDFADVFSDLPDESVDLIITDPPYPEEYLGEWEKLSAFAARVLKPGGFCLAYSGQMHLPKVMQRLSTHLDYYWTICLLQSGMSQYVVPRNLHCGWKPILIFQKSFSLYKPNKHKFFDLIDGSGKAKWNHVWEQGEDELDGLIEYFSTPGDKVLDPFAGSGTTLLKAVKMKRMAFGAEVDEQVYSNAKKRISDGLQCSN